MAGCLQIDLGNSSLKWRLIEGGSVCARGGVADYRSLATEQSFDLSAKPEAVWVASVADDAINRELRSIFQHRWGVEAWFAKTAATLGRLSNSYDNPASMGVDRWLVMLAICQRQPGRFCVVDAGSALTIDLVSEEGAHEGGYIIPGPSLMERSLFKDTQRVRFSEDLPPSLAPGTSTGEAVRHGTTLSLAGALSWVIEHQQLAKEEVFITGGWGQQLRQLACPEASLEPDLVFEGLAAQAHLEGVGIQG